MNGHIVLGIVGKVGSGKSLVAELLRERHGFETQDADLYGHRALESERDRLASAFGPAILSPEGPINRRALGELVFSDSGKMLALNSIVHPRMKNDIEKAISSSECKRHAIDAALLFEIGLHELCDFIVTVEAPEDVIIRRVREYRHWPESKARKVLAAQEYLMYLREETDFVIFNTGDRDKLVRQVDFLVHVIAVE